MIEVVSTSSCSQIRNTRQPLRRRLALVTLSLCRLRRIFSFQYATLELGTRLHLAHPCQKHPSTKMRRRFRRKTKSGLPGRSDGLTSHPQTPALTSAPRNRHSVERLPWERTRPMTLERTSLETVSNSNLFAGLYGGNRTANRIKSLRSKLL
jgi:hypothetical protein